MIWHRGHIREIDDDQRTGRMQRVGGAWGEGDVYFTYGIEIADAVRRAFREDLRVDFWLSGTRAMIYNLIIEGTSTREELNKLAEAWSSSERVRLYHIDVRWSDDSKTINIRAMDLAGNVIARELPDPYGRLAGSPDSDVRTAVSTLLRAENIDAPTDWLFGWTIEQGQYGPRRQR